MTRLDALLAAGVNACRRCQAVGFPTTATWLGDDLLAVTYAAPCKHHGESTLIVVPSALKPLPEPVPPPEPEPVPRCIGVTAAGTWCRNRPRRDSQYCAAHEHQDAERGAR